MSTKVWNAVVGLGAGAKSEASVNASLDRRKHEQQVTEFAQLFDEKKGEQGHSKEMINARKENYMTMVNHYYDLVTDFYEYGWGHSFHFAPRFEGETFDASIARHEHYLSDKLHLRPGMKVLDVGCGVGGPMRAIARFSGASIVGCNNNDYQIKRSEMFNQKYHLDHLCKTEKNDFMKLSYADSSFDACYAIEATCHAPDKVACYSQMFRVLKPGACFAAYEWCITDKYDPKSEYHRNIKHIIEKGDSLPDLVLPEVVIEALKQSGFEVIEHFDIAVTSRKTNPVPWYSTLQGGWKPSNFKHTKWGRAVTQTMVDILEKVHIAPKGTGETHRILSGAADYLSRGGETGTFTPMYYFLARKPLSAK